MSAKKNFAIVLGVDVGVDVEEANDQSIAVLGVESDIVKWVRVILLALPDNL